MRPTWSSLLVLTTIWIPSLVEGARQVWKGLHDPDHAKWAKFSKENPKE